MKKILTIAASLMLASTLTTAIAAEVNPSKAKVRPEANSPEWQAMAGKAFDAATWQAGQIKYQIGGIYANNGTVFVHGISGKYNAKEIKILGVSCDSKDRFLITVEHLGSLPGVSAYFLDTENKEFKAVARKLAKTLCPDGQVDDTSLVKVDIRGIEFDPEPMKTASN